jgi:hypothetical protein
VNRGGAALVFREIEEVDEAARADRFRGEAKPTEGRVRQDMPLVERADANEREVGRGFAKRLRDRERVRHDDADDGDVERTLAARGERSGLASCPLELAIGEHGLDAGVGRWNRNDEHAMERHRMAEAYHAADASPAGGATHPLLARMAIARTSAVSVRITIDRDARVVHSTFSGTLTIVDMLEGRAQVERHPDFARTFAHVLDFADVTDVDIEPRTLRDLAAMPSIFERDAVQIVVAAASSPMFRVAQTYRALAAGSGRNVRIAETFEEARALVVAFG